MRARNLKPGFFKNEDLAECDPLARILFEGLWCMSDREGRLEYRPKRIKAEVLPYDNCDIEQLLSQLEGKFITIYEVDGEKYLQVNKFKSHQNPHCKESASTIPAPCKTGASTEQAPDKNGSRPAESLNLNPESLNLNPSFASSDEKDVALSRPDVFISIPLNDKSEHNVTRPMIIEWQNLYPKIDVEQELRKIRGWSLSNPGKRKTKTGIMKHINSWLAKEQDKGGNGSNQSTAERPDRFPSSPDDDWKREQEAAYA